MENEPDRSTGNPAVQNTDAILTQRTDPVVPDTIETSTVSNDACISRRNLAGFWLLGLCNNFGYVVMLSAAADILKDNPNQNGTNSSSVLPTDNSSHMLIPHCNKIGTGAILLADILPALFLKMTAPWYMQAIPYSVRVGLVIALSAASFPIVAIPKVVWVNILGVALGSAGSGIGEMTFLSLTSHFNKNSVSTWSSGTGAAGVFGALSYAGLTALHLSPRITILLTLVIPVIMGFSYFLLLVRDFPDRYTPVKPHMNDLNEKSRLLPNEQIDNLPAADVDSEKSVKSLSLIDRLKLAKPLLKFMIPLGLVYLAEYFINQALFELIFFEGIWLPLDQQYRWYQVIYQIGVLISRSSVNLVKINKLWILVILQFLNIGILMLQIFYQFLPSIWLVFVLILYEGLLGGAAYVNTFYRITVEIEEDDKREFSMGVVSVSDSMGIAVAGAVSLPSHNALCSLHT